MPRIKKSYGIICCRSNKSGAQILMVKKATTYHFCEFVAGHYKFYNEQHLKRLFNNMTYYEKMDILSLKFPNLWYRIYMESPEHNKGIWITAYIKKKSMFELAFLQDGGDKLQRLISNSINGDTPWEFPKGRKDNEQKETDLETAIREFTEETGITGDKYKILWHIKPYVETYTDFGTTYQNKYYYVQAIGDWDPVYKFYDKRQISEVSTVRWISINDIKYMQLEDVTFNRLTRMFAKILKKYKNDRSQHNTILVNKLLGDNKPLGNNKPLGDDKPLGNNKQPGNNKPLGNDYL
jgi:8-oxo-dGTP pyrophosphatase MutT (NUDIX family)